MLRPFRLERELDRAVSQWLEWLPRWDPATARRRIAPCATCPCWIEDLGLEEVPHGVMHALTTSLDAVIVEHVRRGLVLQPGLEEGTVERQRVDRRRDAVALVQRRHDHVVRALDVHVEPKVQHMAALLIADVTA